MSKLMKPMASRPRTDHYNGSPENALAERCSKSPKHMENKKMDRTELLETAASWVAGIATGCAFVALYVALTAPVAETVLKFVS